MSTPQKEPLRLLRPAEESNLHKISRSLSLSAATVTRAQELLRVAEGKNFSEAARLTGRKSGDAVAQLVTRFNKAGLSALETRHRGGPVIVYQAPQQARILLEFKRSPSRKEDGTATWSLQTLQRALRKAPDGLPEVSTYTIWCTLHQAGFTWQKNRSWCQTGTVMRLRKSGPVQVSDPDTQSKKN